MIKKIGPDFWIASLSLFFSALLIWVINPSLHQFLQQTAWLKNPFYLKHHLGFAGGITEYFALFLSGLLKSKLAGSILILLLNAIVLILLKRILESISNGLITNNVFVGLWPLFIFILLIDYLFYFSVLVNIVLVIVFVYLQCLFKNHQKQKTLLILPAGILIYYICGGGYFLIFMVSSIFLAFSDDGKIYWHRILVSGVLAFVIPFLFYKFLFPVSLEQAYFRIVPDVAPMLRYPHKNLIIATLCIVPLFILVSVIGSRIKFFKVQPDRSNRLLLFSILFIAGSYLIVWYFVFDEQEKIKAEIEYNAATENWDKVTELAAHIEKYDRMVNFQFNRAICHEGKMLEKLFDYPQLLGTQGLFLDKPFTSEVALPSSDLYFDLGNIDESQRYAFEAQTLMHYSPRVLSRLTMNNVILGNFAGAKSFAKVLEENPFEKRRAEKLEKLVEDQNLAAGDPVVSEKRVMMNKPSGIFLTPREKLIDLLDKNPENKKAFEYLIAFDLMEHDLASFTKHMDYFPAFGYNKLPIVIEEAVVLFLSQRPDNLFLKSFKISETTSRRFSEFVKTIQSVKGDKQKGKQAAEKFKNTYWYYVLFDSPLVTKIQVETRPSEANY